MRSSRPPTMNDVAAAAGVGLKTVSRYVNGATNINQELSERIGAAIEALGYRHNLAAASIRPGRSSKVVGLIISDLANPYYSVLARSVERVCTEHGYLLMSASSEEDAGRHRLLVDRLVAQRVDGLVVVPPRQATTSWATSTIVHVPMVLVDRPTGPLESVEVHTVLADNAGGATRATAAMLAAGARRVAFLGDSLELYTMRERLAGYHRALAEADLGGATGTGPIEPIVSDGAHSVEDAAAVVAGFLASGEVDAVFAANNRAAIGAMQAFATAGRRLPLVGFDDFEAAPLVSPAVSVVAQNVALMGRVAAETLLGLIAGEAGPPVTHTLDVRLELRGSER
ncbi:transcriptional regulator, LacI family [Plantibacter sp. VKM Ac-1784]|uniref:Transcriptional regulator, LacI family n=1 Tax=Plantibacter elymi (nom. nud.) TaxID=199708 RepID=A0ABY1RDJ4_9MICO|nr:LacI family DNA-binding transcriptional regulator [Plantibacter sp. VKM Ac-1784]SMQ70978.1 transcriptional regulator, LacI family [Plantibacter sp. VKM Ac-1784]